MTTALFRVGLAVAVLTNVGLSNASAGDLKSEPTTQETAQKSYEQELLEQSPFSSEEFTPENITEEEMSAVRAAVNAKRDPAATAPKMSAEFQAVRDRFLRVKSSTELDAVLSELNAKYDTYKSEDTRLFAAQAVTLVPFRGIVWRLIPVASQAKITHSAVLTMVKQLASGIGIYLPTQQWQAGFDYVSLPYSRNGVASTQLQNEAQVQSFLSSSVVLGPNGLVKARNRINAIDLRNKEVVWDNKLLYGPASFKDDLDRYRSVGEVEKMMVLASLNLSIAQLAFGRAYSAQGSINMAESIGKLYGIDGWFSSVEGAPAQDRVGVIRSRSYSNWGRLVKDGPNWTGVALSNIRNAAIRMSSVWDQVQRRPASEMWAVDPSFFQNRDLVRTGNLRVDEVVAMTKGPAKIRSSITSETVTVNLPAFYTNPPKDLKALFPTEFNRDPEWSKVALASGNKTVNADVRNYKHGSAIGWNTSEYRTFLPDARSSADIQRAARVLSQSWGGNAAFAPMLAFMN